MKARIVFLLGLLACGKRGDEVLKTGVASKESVTKTSRSGPVTAKVTAAPAKPLLGEPISVTIEVTAEAGVEVTMPAFGDALGRFAIIDFAPKQKTAADGSSTLSQRYTLDAPMSGKQKIPPFLVEFADRRKDAGMALHELETEELTVEVASVMPEGSVTDELRPARGALTETSGRAGRLWPWFAALGALCVTAVAVAIVVGRRARARVTAYDFAKTRLAALEARGYPASEEADVWYVELSSIVRKYLEDRYGLRAPERTTEEFLREAGQAAALAAEHRALLSTFLARCDQVKFAGYRPAEPESRDALWAARQFIEETRIAPGALETRVAPGVAQV